MLVSHRKKFIFTKTVKTAGTSVESYFEKWCMPEGAWRQVHIRDEYYSVSGVIGERSGQVQNSTWYNHMSANTIRSQVGDTIWEDYFKFSIVRNPFDKLVSGFYWFHRDVDMKGSEVGNFKLWLKNLLKQANENESIVGGRDVPHYLKPKELSLIDRDKYLINGEVCVDHFIQYENLLEGIRSACNIVEIPFDHENLKELKKGFRNTDISPLEYYEGGGEDIVQELYGWELSRFNYSLSEY